MEHLLYDYTSYKKALDKYYNQLPSPYDKKWDTFIEPLRPRLENYIDLTGDSNVIYDVSAYRKAMGEFYTNCPPGQGDAMMNGYLEVMEYGCEAYMKPRLEEFKHIPENQ